MAIKMRVNKNQESRCFNCNVEWKNTGEMFDLAIGYNKERVLPLCRKCVDVLFTKTLKATTTYNSKIKTKEDQMRIRRENSLCETGPHISLNEALKGMNIKED